MGDKKDKGKKMFKAMFNKDAAKMIVENENKQRKMMILIGGIMVGVLCFIWMCLYFARLDSVRWYQEMYKKWVSMGIDDRVWYDSCVVAPGYMYTDVVEAAKIGLDILPCDWECVRVGTSWSSVYAMNGTLMLFLLLNMCCVCIGAYVYILRMIGAICGLCCCCLHFIFILVTPVLRFQPKGQLCALNPSPTMWTGDNAVTDWSDAWTFEKDAGLITALWVLQLLCCCCCCVGGAVTPMSVKN